jgi:hypothetical protein
MCLFTPISAYQGCAKLDFKKRKAEMRKGLKKVEREMLKSRRTNLAEKHGNAECVTAAGVNNAQFMNGFSYFRNNYF